MPMKNKIQKPFISFHFLYKVTSITIKHLTVIAVTVKACTQK